MTTAAECTNGQRVYGYVIWFSDFKGYGYIRLEGSQDEIYVHFTALPDSTENPATGRKRLLPDQHVQFTIEQQTRGKKAVDVRVIPQSRRILEENGEINGNY